MVFAMDQSLEYWMIEVMVLEDSLMCYWCGKLVLIVVEEEA